jgi:hypothetical protein
MTGRSFFSGIVLVAALAIMAALWGMEHKADRLLHEQADSSRQLLAQLNRLEVENFRLSNIVAQADVPLAEVQLAELAKLRQEVLALRRRTNDLQTLQAELRRVRAELLRARNSIDSKGPPDVPAEDIYPRDKWTFAGFDTPEAAVESATWAISEGDEESYMASLSPDLRDEMQSELADGIFEDTGPLEMSNATGFRIVDRDSVSDDEVIVTIYVDGEGTDVPLRLVKTADGWKVAGDDGD